MVKSKFILILRGFLLVFICLFVFKVILIQQNGSKGMGCGQESSPGRRFRAEQNACMFLFVS